MMDQPPKYLPPPPPNPNSPTPPFVESNTRQTCSSSFVGNKKGEKSFHQEAITTYKIA